MVFVSSPLPEPPWSSRRRRRPRREPLTREALTTVALRIVDTDGLDALSMRRLAQEVGVQASGLYTYVSGKAELLQLVLDRVAAEVHVPDPDTELDPVRWQEQVKEVARAIHAAFVAHRDLAGAALANIPTGPNTLLVVERFLALLRSGGLSARAAGLAADLLPQYVTIAAYEHSLFEQRMTTEPDYFDRLAAYYRSLPADRFPVLASMVGELMSDEDDERFEFGLDVIVRGLAALAG
jgi:AcrR family transcriptional regulator